METLTDRFLSGPAGISRPHRSGKERRQRL
jgi:hypothetical protein